MARILVVDDEARMVDLIRRELEDHGYSVTTAGDGPSALELMESGDFDLVITDLRMPGMDGLDLLKQARERFPRTEIVLMTAYASAQTAVKAMKEGAYDYLTKPFEMDELLIMVERIGELQRLELENTQLREKIAGEEVSLWEKPL
jgi:DNA-binding NtrC family response regulator